MSLCYRCEFRAQFMETGHGPRCECKEIKSSTSGCYQYKPVKPLILLKDKGDDRPQFAGAMLSSRSRSGGSPDLRLSICEDTAGPIPYWTPKSLDELHIKARDILWFLDCHPALGSPVFNTTSLLSFSIHQVCKNGYSGYNKNTVSVYYTLENYKKYKKEFDKEFKEYSEKELKTLKRLIAVQIPYETIYGVKWHPDHIEYWGDITFVIYKGKDFKETQDLKFWDRYSGCDASGRTFEEMIMNIGKKFKSNFGNFNKENFLTPKEKENNKSLSPFLVTKIKDNSSAKLMKRNPKYINISPAEINRRWLKWFAKTPYCKKHWVIDVKKILGSR